MDAGEESSDACTLVELALGVLEEVAADGIGAAWGADADVDPCARLDTLAGKLQRLSKMRQMELNHSRQRLGSATQGPVQKHQPNCTYDCILLPHSKEAVRILAGSSEMSVLLSFIAGTSVLGPDGDLGLAVPAAAAATGGIEPEADDTLLDEYLCSIRCSSDSIILRVAPSGPIAMARKAGGAPPPATTVSRSWQTPLDHERCTHMARESSRSLNRMQSAANLSSP